jgi:hypothetical protein
MEPIVRCKLVSRVEAGTNTSTVGGDEKGTQCLGV